MSARAGLTTHEARAPEGRAGLLVAAACFAALAGCGPGPIAQAPSVVSDEASPKHVVFAPKHVPSSSSSIRLEEAPPETLRIESHSKDRVAQCLGVLIAPRVALTASHCLEGRSAARVRLARSEHDAFVGVERFWSDPRQTKGRLTVDSHAADVSVLLLERPIALASYPEVARHPAPGWIAATGLR